MLLFYCFLLKKYSAIALIPQWWIFALFIDVMNILFGGLMVLTFLG